VKNQQERGNRVKGFREDNTVGEGNKKKYNNTNKGGEVILRKKGVKSVGKELILKLDQVKEEV